MPKRSPLPEPKTFDNAGRRIAYRELGSGPRVIVLVHGLLMDVRMFTMLAPTLAAAGNRVILCDMLGHGASHQTHDMADYSMPQFGRDVIALLEAHPEWRSLNAGVAQKLRRYEQQVSGVADG